MDNMVYITVCKGWSNNGVAQWDVVAAPVNKAYKMHGNTVYYNGTMYSGSGLYSTAADAWASTRNRWRDSNRVDMQRRPQWPQRCESLPTWISEGVQAVIYAEWLDCDGDFHADIFLTLDDYYNATFCPDIKIITVRGWSYK